MKIGIIERAFFLSVIFGLFSSIGFLFLTGTVISSSENMARMLTTNLQVDAVLLGFSATIIVYVLKVYSKEVPFTTPNWVSGTALAILLSYMFSFFFGFVLMFSIGYTYYQFAFIPFSFTLGAIIFTIIFLHLAILEKPKNP